MCDFARIVRCIASMLALCAGFMSLPGELCAQDGSGWCHVEIHELETETERNAILTPIQIRYDISLDNACHFRIIPTAQMPMVCSKPSQEILPGTTPGRHRARVETECQFRRPGFFYAPPVQFEVTSNHDKKTSIVSPRLHPIEIVPQAPESPAPFENLLKIQRWTPQLSTFWIILFGALILAMGSVIAWSIRNSTQAQKQLEEEQREPRPIERFLAQIAPLAESAPTSVEEFKIFHDVLSYALRTYLAEKFKLDMMSCTTRNLKQLLIGIGISEASCSEILRILFESDRVKFAQNIPSQASIVLLIKNANGIVSRLEEDFPDESPDTQGQPAVISSDTPAVSGTSV